MAQVRDLSQAQLVFQVEGGDIDQFLVTRFSGTEGLCQLYRFEIELVSHEATVDFDTVVGQPAVLGANSDFGPRHVHGIISRFEMTGESEGQTFFRAELVPTLWLLTHRYKSRVFQDQSIKEIIAQVLEEGGITSDTVDMSGVQGASDTCEFCVQYRETDYNFICRLMEEEGIYWYFHQLADGHRFVLADNATYPSIEGESQLPYVPPSGLTSSAEHISSLRIGRSVRPGTVVLSDFNFEKPTVDLKSDGDAGRDGALEFYDYPGEFTEQSRGQKLAQMRTEEFEAGRTLIVGQTNSPRFTVGSSFEVTEHPSESVNGTYLLTSVHYEGHQSTERTSSGTNGRARAFDTGILQSLQRARQSEDETTRDLATGLLQIESSLQAGDPTAHRALTHWLYHAGQVSRDLPATAQVSGENPLEPLALPNLIDDIVKSGMVDLHSGTFACRFEAIPASAAYRPPRITPWPQMRGTQTATVFGPEGEEIHTDKYGRVLVRFHWDREEKNSCWIRVAQNFAGGQYGMIFIPRVGQEVIVDFLEGNPDQPIIIGRVYNADNMPPYELPKEQTKSTIKTHSTPGGEGFNEIRFEDKKGKEQIFIHAQRRMDVRVRGSLYETNYGNREMRIGWEKGGDGGGDCNTLVKQDTNIHIKRDIYEWNEGKLNKTVKEDVVEDFQKNQTTMVKDICSLNAAQVIVEGQDVVSHRANKITQGASDAFSVKAGGLLRLESNNGIHLKVGGNFVVIDPSGVKINGTMVGINSGGSAQSPEEAFEVEEAEIEDPLDAAGADTGKPGVHGRGGGQPRTRNRRTLEPQNAPPYLPPPPPPGQPPPEQESNKTCGIAEMKVNCSHADRNLGSSRVIQVVAGKTSTTQSETKWAGVSVGISKEHGGEEQITADVVTNDGGTTDRRETALIRSASGGSSWQRQGAGPNTHTVSRHGNDDIWPINAAPDVWYLYGRGCDEVERRYRIENFPNQKYEVDIGYEFVREWIEDINKALKELTSHSFGPVDFHIEIQGPAGHLKGSWGWKEDNDWQTYFNVEARLGLDPILGVSFIFTVSFVEIAGTAAGIPPSIMDIVSEHLADVFARVTFGLSAHLEGGPNARFYANGNERISGTARSEGRGTLKIELGARVGSDSIVSVTATGGGETGISAIVELELERQGLFLIPRIESRPLTFTIKVVFKAWVAEQDISEQWELLPAKRLWPSGEVRYKLFPR